MGKEILKYRSHGKLLITGEYLVMYGARALALPVKFGQSMEVTSTEIPEISWEAAIQERPWFRVRLTVPDLEIIQTDDHAKTEYLIQVMKAARELNPAFLSNTTGFQVKTRLDYPQEWGLGSSSSFISNMASWAEVPPMELNRKVSSGSGYDIACTRADSAIVFQIQEQKPCWETIGFEPAWKEQLYFLYLGKKQDTAGSIKSFKNNYQLKPEDVNAISGLTDLFLKAGTAEEAGRIIERHERYLSDILNIRPVQKQFFSDFEGSVKSLGAWGGDFAMVVSALPEAQIRDYFLQRGFLRLFSYKEIRLG